MSEIIQRIKEDVRVKEALHSCISCGVCTAICPAAEFYDYSPRQIALTVQNENEEKILNLLKSDTIWFCGQCMSCKTRCPRNNCSGMLISVLRKISQEEGYFIHSRMGRQQLLLKRQLGNAMLKYGYCIHPDIVAPDEHPEQGSVWEWIYDNKQKVYERLNANLDKPGEGTLRKIEQESLDELQRIFDVSGATDLFNSIEKFSAKKAEELGIKDQEGKLDDYVEYIKNEY